MTLTAKHWPRTLAIAALGAALCTVPGSAQRRGDFGGQEGFRFRFVGPAIGNRIDSAAAVPGDPNIYYAGAASGGIFKSTDGGASFRPIFDNEPAAAIGALAVTPSNPNIVWAGTGEAWFIRDTDVPGNGIYKSTDAGRTWTNMGLGATGRIGRILVNPKDADNVFVCALGRGTGPQQERGVFRTTDGGQHWDRVLFVDENTGCSGLSMDPQNPTVLFAGTWTVEAHPWVMKSGGPGSGVFVTRDGGTKWTRIEGHGLPRSPLGKIDVAIAPTNPDRVFALIQTKDQGSLWRSDDGGNNWRVVSWDRRLIGRAGYYIHIAVSPANENDVLIANSTAWRSIDGGLNFESSRGGGDTHDIWWDPTNANRFIITDDGGMNITTSNGSGFHRVQLPIGQMYHVAVDNQIPYYIYGNMQDDGTMRMPSTSMGGRGGSGEEHGLGGCESGFTLPDPVDPNIVWSSCYGNEITRWDARTKLARSVSPWIHTLDSPPTDVKYRCHWTPPVAIDPFDHNSVYYGCQVIFKTTNGGQSWSVISPDLSTQDPAHIVSSGGIVGDNLGQFYGEVVFAIAPSTVQKGLIWAGTNDGLVWYTKDGGANWTNVTKNIPGLPPLGVVSSISPSAFDAGTAYVTIDMHLSDDRTPYVYKTADFGQTWTKISSNLPKDELGYARVIAADPNQKGVLFVGTGNAFYYSLNDGETWTNLQAGLPHVPVSWIVVQKQFHDVVISTYGRGFYILDDITPLEQMAAGGQDAPVRLFAPRPAYRFARGARADLNFSLKEAPRGPVQLEILDARNNVIRELRAPGRPGLNRATWDLRYDSARPIALRTAPPDNPHIWEEARFRGAETRPISHWGIQGALAGPMVTPGKYTVKLTVNGQSYTQPLEIVRDPKTTGTDADLEATMKIGLKVRDDINAASDMVNRIEFLRKQLQEAAKSLRGDRAKAETLKAVEAMDKRMEDVERRFVTREDVTSDDKYYVEAYKVYMNLLWFNGVVNSGAGDVAGPADYGPTDAAPQVLAMIEKDLAAAQADYKTLMEKELPAFNKSMVAAGVSPMM
jgi:photosystem II stability/assembly factor-like uncharacterized protein